MMNIGGTALNAAAAQLDIVSHNVANVNTEGYSRQSVVQTTRTAQYTTNGFYGSGVQAVTVIQHVDSYLQGQITDATSGQAYYANLVIQLSRLETLANEAGETGLGEDLTAFFSAWDDVSNYPTLESVREVLNEVANNLVSRLGSISQDLLDVTNDLNGYLKAGVTEINSICQSIARLNQQIGAAEVGGDSANDFRDERNRLLNELGEYIAIDWFEDSDGSVTVVTGQGLTLVQDNIPDSDDEGPLAWAYDDETGKYQVTWASTGLVLDSDELKGGKMDAWLTVRDGEIPEIQEFMDELANTLIWEVNLVHSQGTGLKLFTSVAADNQVEDITAALNSEASGLSYGSKIKDGSLKIWVYEGETRRSYTIDFDADDSLQDICDAINNALTGDNDPVATITPNGSLTITAPTGVEFAFANEEADDGSGAAGLLAALGINTYFSGDNALNIEVCESVSENVGLIAAGRLTDDGEYAVGDNRNALDLFDLKDANTMNNGSESFNEAIINWSSELGSTVASAKDNYLLAETTFTELMEQRDNISAVSLDEEMVKLIQYQRSYQMAAKLISAADELLTTLLDLA
jgi:flagellar hook-associated protein 1 FlgK